MDLLVIVLPASKIQVRVLLITFCTSGVSRRMCSLLRMSGIEPISGILSFSMRQVGHGHLPKKRIPASITLHNKRLSAQTTHEGDGDSPLWIIRGVRK